MGGKAKTVPPVKNPIIVIIIPNAMDLNKCLTIKSFIVDAPTNEYSFIFRQTTQQKYRKK